MLGPTGNSGIDPRTGEQARKRRSAIHFDVFYSTSEQYADVRDRIIPVDGRWMDPVTLFRKKLPLDSDSIRAQPEPEKQVPISVMLDNGETFPARVQVERSKVPMVLSSGQEAVI